MSQPKKQISPFLKKASGEKPPTRAAVEAKRRHGGLGRVGRGLDNLVSAPTAPIAPEMRVSPVAAPDAGRVLQVPVAEIERSPYQPRTEFRAESLQELADSLRANGVIQPLTCRRRPDGKLELICGERRLRAAQLAGMRLVPVTVKEVDDATAATMTVTENAQRDDLNPIEEAEGYRTLVEKFGRTQNEVADSVGKSRTSVTHALRLLELPDDVQDLLRKKAISTGHAKVLLSLENKAEIRRLALECAPRPDPRTGEPVGGLTVRELERRIARNRAPAVERTSAVPDMPESYTRAVADEIHKTLGCAVRLTSAARHANGRRTKGLLEIDLLDNNDLDRVLAIMGVKMD